MEDFFRITFQNAFGDAEAWVSPAYIAETYPSLLSAWSEGRISNVRVWAPGGIELNNSPLCRLPSQIDSAPLPIIGPAPHVAA